MLIIASCGVTALNFLSNLPPLSSDTERAKRNILARGKATKLLWSLSSLILLVPHPNTVHDSVFVPLIIHLSEVAQETWKRWITGTVTRTLILIFWWILWWSRNRVLNDMLPCWYMHQCQKWNLIISHLSLLEAKTPYRPVKPR